MRIIHAGPKPAHPLPWYYATEITCTSCHTVFILEPTDIFVGKSSKEPGGSLAIRLNCPNCTARLMVDRPHHYGLTLEDAL